MLLRRGTRVGLRRPLDLCRYLFMLGYRVIEVLFQPPRRCFRPEPPGSCRRFTVVVRRSPFQ